MTHDARPPTRCLTPSRAMCALMDRWAERADGRNYEFLTCGVRGVLCRLSHGAQVIQRAGWTIPSAACCALEAWEAAEAEVLSFDGEKVA